MPKDLGAFVPPDFCFGLFRVWIHGRQFPDASDAWDANWLRITARYSGGGSSVNVTGALLDAVSFKTFRRGLTSMASTMKGEAALESVEPNLSLRLYFSDTLGHIGGDLNITPDQLNEQHRYKLAELDQTDLSNLIGQLNAIAIKHPVKLPQARGV